MRTICPRFFRNRWLLAAFSLALLFTPCGQAQMMDANSNGMSDVWEWVNNANGVNPNTDSDGDGFINRQEALAGTSPFNSNSLPRIPAMTGSPTNFSVTLPVALGKQYQLQSVATLGGTNWVVETNWVARTGTNLTLTAPVTVGMKFYRVAISDVDSDGDGLNDWEEYQLGLDPFTPASSGQQDFNGVVPNDFQYAAAKLAGQNIITIATTDPVVMQPDAGQTATDFGVVTVTRGGFPLNAITINLGPGNAGTGMATAGLDYLAPASVTLAAGVASQSINVTPLANTNLSAPVVATVKLWPGTGYTVGGPSNASVVVYPSVTAQGTGLTGRYFTNSSTTYTNSKNFNLTNLFLTRMDPAIDFTWTNGVTPNLSNGLYSVRWTGQVQPQYSETYVFDTVSDDGVRLWVNDQLLIDKWQNQGGTEWTNAITLQGGTRYNLKLEYLQNGSKAQAHLYWYSPNQSRQIIPNARLYPTNSVNGSSNAPAVVTSALSAVGFLGQPFSFTVTGANSPLGFTAQGLPPGLGFNGTNGLISGTPTLAGNFQVLLTASNAVGLGASVVNLQILDTGSSVVREIWTSISGSEITNIPTGIPANLTNTLGSLDGPTNYADKFGERVRGYLTAPVTGNYYFWVSGCASVELWISNDSEPVNKILRAVVRPDSNPSPPPQNGTAAHQWNLQASQKSGWLALTAGQKYYIEILHKADTGSGDNWSVGWRQDPTGTNDTPAEVVPGYVLSRYYPAPPVNIPGNLYSANLLADPGVMSTAVGSASLRVSADGTQAILAYSVNGIPTLHVDHIYSDPYLNKPSVLLYDIAAARPQADGSYVWKIKPTGALSTADILEIIKQNKAYVEIQTPAYPGGEISGHFTLANGTQIFTPPPAPPAWTDDHTSTNAVVRFLTQATFGAKASDITAVRSAGYATWINNQMALPATHHLPMVLANVSANPNTLYPSSLWFNTWWQQSVTAPDQLRQRVAFALSEIMVISDNSALQDNARALSGYYDTLVDNAFGNFRSLLKSVTLSPAMGIYLDMRSNDKGSLVTGLHANENYAREIQQLFSIGLNRMWPDGTLVLDSQNNIVPTYNQNVVMGFASVFTGWNYYQTNQANGRLPSNWYPSSNYTNAMVLVPTHHELGTKLLLNNVVLPPAWGSQADTTSTNFDNYCSQDLEAAMDSICNNPNVGPFLCRQLIQRLVTSNPSRDYLYRVVQKFNDNGAGVRGDLSAVVKAILLDYEARSTNLLVTPTYGKQREPLLRVTAVARAFPAPANLNATYTESGTQTITITTPSAHRLNNNDYVWLNFTDNSGHPAPNNQRYSITTTNSKIFTVNAPNLLTGTYGQTNNVITLNISSHGLVVGNSVYLAFPTGGAASGSYPVVAVNSSSLFTVATADAATRSGSSLLFKISTSGFKQTTTNVTVSCAGPHGLVAGNLIYLPANSYGLAAGQYPVATVPDATHFTFIVTNSASQTQSSLAVNPLVAPALNRSGTVAVQFSTWNLGETESGSTYSLSQSPLSANTVFNFFFPDYQFPGVLASAGLTTPEFQLTSDTSVALQMNFLSSGILNNTGNTNGLSSFTAGDGDIGLDLGPWMTTNYTSAAGVPGLVDSLNTTLLAGQLSSQAKTAIVHYVTNTATGYFPYSTPPTSAQMRDRVRAVVHLLINSPDFTIQK